MNSDTSWMRRATKFVAVPSAVGLLLSLWPTVAWCDDWSAGPNGINSRVLAQTGAGVNIGQVELGRPGESFSIPADAAGEWFWDHGPDQTPGTADAGEGNGVRDAGEWFVDVNGSTGYTPGFLNAHPDVEPWDTYVLASTTPARTPLLNSPPPGGVGTFITLNTYWNSVATIADPQVDDHALSVAGVMIANGAANTGVSTGARLYSGAFGLRNSSDDDVLVTTQAIQRAADVRSINHSWGSGPLGAGTNDGSSALARGVDYFSSVYDTLHVIAGDELQIPPSHPGTPSDAYNVLNVSMLTDASGLGTGVYNRYDAGNRFVASPGSRDTVHLAAPGRSIFMPQLGTSGYATSSGTSFAAPHVTATSALLHQYGNAQQIADPANWDASARTHQVVKVVLLNSADKLIDDGTIVPKGNLLGMQKTIFINSAGNDTWLNSPAYNNPPDPLDDHVGTGALNASRAFTQYAAGEHDSDLTTNGIVPVIGWDNAFSQGVGGEHWYFFDEQLRNNSFISATLSWDRVVTLNDTNGNNLFDAGETFSTPAGALQLADLDLFLYKKNDITGLFTDLVTSSISGVDSTEHIFYHLADVADYALRVFHLGGNTATTEFGLAWWAVAVPEPASGLMMLLAGVATLLVRRHRAVR